MASDKAEASNLSTTFCSGLIYNKQKTEKAFFLQIVPFFIMALLMGCFFVFATKSNTLNTPNTNVTFAWWQRIILACYALTEYICKAFVPYNLRFKYYYPLSPTDLMPLRLLFYPSLITTIIFAFRNVLKRPIIITGVLIFFIHLILVLHIIPIDRQHIIADRYMYLSIVGIAFPIVYYGTSFYKQLKNKKFKFIIQSFVLLAIVSFSFKSYERTLKWHDSITIYEDVQT